jgi:hypothetical protein
MIIIIDGLNQASLSIFGGAVGRGYSEAEFEESQHSKQLPAHRFVHQAGEAGECGYVNTDTYCYIL